MDDMKVWGALIEAFDKNKEAIKEITRCDGTQESKENKIVALLVGAVNEELKRLRGFEVAKGFEDEGVKLPTRATASSAGYDFYAQDSAVIESGEVRKIPTGVKAYMLPDEVLKIYPRSSVAIKRNLALANGVAVIDADFAGNPENDGHIIIALKNTGKEPQTIYKGDRIAQGIFQKYLDCGDAPDKERIGGIGSTGI